MKIIVVDTNTFIASGWRVNTHARRVFAGVARRRFRLAVSAAILEEYHGVSQRSRFAGKNYGGLLSWIEKYGCWLSLRRSERGGRGTVKTISFLPVRCPQGRGSLCPAIMTCSIWESRLESRSYGQPNSSHAINCDYRPLCKHGATGSSNTFCPPIQGENHLRFVS